MSPASPLQRLSASAILALDTATDRPTIAVGTPRAPGDEVAARHRRDLSKDIDRLTRELLAARGLTAASLGAVVVADGPGSFTGLRIGIAFAKGLARVLGIPLLSAPSMLGAAASACASARWPGGDVLVEYDALRGDVFRAAYRFEPGRVETIARPALGLRGEPAPSGAVRASERDASAAALLSLVGATGGPAEVADPGAWQPDYGRPAEAEARRLARHGR